MVNRVFQKLETFFSIEILGTLDIGHWTLDIGDIRHWRQKNHPGTKIHLQQIQMQSYLSIQIQIQNKTTT